MSEVTLLYNELSVVKHFSDITAIGADKLVGYLALPTIEENLSDGVKKLARWAQLMGYHHWFDLLGCVKGGALYIWYEKGLQDFLNSHAEILQKANVPTTPFEYIFHIATTTVPEGKFPAAYIVIGKSFNDKRFSSVTI